MAALAVRRSSAPASAPSATFLELCIALPGRGRELLAELDLDSVFGSPLARAAAAHLRTHLEAPASGVADAALAALLAELAVRAAALAPVPAELEVERRQLELARVDRAIAGARGSDAVAAERRSAHEREAVKRELDRWLDRGCSSRPLATRLTRARGAAVLWSNCPACGGASAPPAPIPG